jgi:hypothetical protein
MDKYIKRSGERWLGAKDNTMGDDSARPMKCGAEPVCWGTLKVSALVDRGQSRGIKSSRKLAI